MPPGGVFAEADAAKPPGFLRRTGVMKLNGLHGAFLQWRGKIHKDRPQFARVFQFGRARQNFVYVQVGKQVQLNARVFLQHFEADRIFAADRLLFGINTDVQVIRKQIVVGTPRAVFPAQNVRARRRLRPGRLRRSQRDQYNQRQTNGSKGVTELHVVSSEGIKTSENLLGVYRYRC